MERKKGGGSAITILFMVEKSELIAGIGEVLALIRVNHLRLFILCFETESIRLLRQSES